MTGIRDLLSKAIGDDEPPVGIDRDEVFRVGRQRVRRRRALAASGVVAAVVAAVVGATVLTDFVEVRPDEVPVADAPPAPPGPELPLPPSTRTKPPPSLTDRHANDLTQKLYSSGLVDLATAEPWPGRPGPHVKFRLVDGEYLYEADIAAHGREGQLQVTVGVAAKGVPSCDNLGERYDSCAIATAHGRQVVQATWKGGKGERRNLAVTVLPDGTQVAAIATNLLRRDEDQGKSADCDVTVLDVKELTMLVTKSGFSV